MPELPDIELYLHALRAAGRRAGGRATRPDRATRSCSARPRRRSTRSSAARVTDLRRLGKRIVVRRPTGVFARPPPDDRRPPAWKPAGGADPEEARACRARLRRTARSCSPRPARSAARRCTWRPAPRPGGDGSRRSRSAGVPTPASFAPGSTAERHTLKRALTDPALFSGIGNAYSDEILHRARLSPMRMSDALTDDEIARLFEADAVRCCRTGSTR